MNDSQVRPPPEPPDPRLHRDITILWVFVCVTTGLLWYSACHIADLEKRVERLEARP